MQRGEQQNGAMFLCYIFLFVLLLAILPIVFVFLLKTNHDQFQLTTTGTDMNIEQLQLILNALSTMGVEAKGAFIWFLVFDKDLPDSRVAGCAWRLCLARQGQHHSNLC